MADETISKAEIAQLLQSIRDEQDFTQGQVEALRVALYSAFRAVQSNAELRVQVETNLEARLQLMKKHKDPRGTIAGYESALRDLLLGFHADNPADKTH